MACKPLTVIRKSTRLITVIVFLSLFTDSLLLTLVDPILPDIIANLDAKSVTSGNITTTAPGNITNTTTSLGEGTGGDNASSAIDLINDHGRYGFLVAAKGAAQFVFNPFVGILVTRCGFRVPMLLGDLVLLVSTVAFAYGSSYEMLFITRLLQGASSAVAAVTGMGLLASVFTDDEERGKVMGIAIGGISLGIIIGPVYGSILYQFFGQAVPFIVVAVMIGGCMILQILTLQADTPHQNKDHSLATIFRLISDPYILIVAGNIFLLNLDVSVILAFLPLRLIDLENPATWKLGLVVLPTSIGYLIAGVIFPRTTRFISRWLCGLMGLVLSSATLVGLAFSDTFVLMLVVTTFLGLALGMVSTSMQPIFALLVDLRHSAAYGNVYAISDMAVCLAMFVGPLVGGPIVFTYGFQSLVLGIAVLNLCFSLLCLYLRNPPARDLGGEETESLIVPEAPVKGLLDYGTTEDKVPQPAISSMKHTTEARFRARASSAASSRTSVTMDLSHMPVPRYLECLSAAEDLYSDIENTYTRDGQHTHISF